MSTPAGYTNTMSKGNMTETVTIPRNVYNTLATAYNSVKQRDYADHIAASVRHLTDDELDALPTVTGHPEPAAYLPTPESVDNVEDMRRDGTIYEDADGDHWRWNSDTLEVRETTQDDPNFYPYLSTVVNPNEYTPFTPTS